MSAASVTTIFTGLIFITLLLFIVMCTPCTASAKEVLTMVARVANKPLHISAPAGTDNEEMVDATVQLLGGDNFRILHRQRSRRNSHGIVVNVDGNRITWTWPHIAVGDVDISPKGDWVPVLGAQQEGVQSNYIQIHQFCELANKGESNVIKSRYGNVQLQYWMESKKYCPSSQLSPLAQSFTPAASRQGNTKLSPSAVPFTPAVVCPRATKSEGGMITDPPQTIMEPSTPQQSSVRTSKEGGEEEGILSATPKERLHEQINKDAALFKKVGWKEIVNIKRSRKDFASLDNVNHPAQSYLKCLKNQGAPVHFSTAPWSREKIDHALTRGAHKSCMGFLNFLHEEFEDMINKGQWLILPASAVKDLPGLRISPPGVVPQRGRRPRWIVDYSFWGVNDETLPLAALESMQFGNALDRILREILMADPTYGPIELMKVDLSDGFYRVDLNVGDVPKLGVVFPTEPGEEQLVAFPLVLPMGWTNSPAHFSAATETVADMANDRLLHETSPPPHPLDDLAEEVPADDPTRPSPPSESVPASTSSEAQNDNAANQQAEVAVPVPLTPDPSLPSRSGPVSYVDVFVDDIIALAQKNGNKQNRRRVRRIVLRAIDDVFRPLDEDDNPFRREPVSLKKLKQGDCSWSTIKVVLGWIIDTATMTIQLPPHRVERLAEILASIPKSQKRTSVRKWHKVLGELRSMSIALPGSRNLFSQMQHALTNKLKGRVALNKGVHQALDDFRWLFNSIAERPTRIAELVPLLSSAEGHHDASGIGAGGIWFPSEHLVPRDGYDNRPVWWRIKWPQYIIDRLVTSENPHGTISNSDLELAGGLLHLEALAQTFDIRERTILSKTDNLNTLFWQRKGSATTEKVPAHLLRLFGIHQRFHRYVPRHDYIPGESNPIADALSRDFEMSWRELFESLNSYLPNGTSVDWASNPSALTPVIRVDPTPPLTSCLRSPTNPHPSSHRVRFNPKLVTSIQTRPRTPRAEVSRHYYTTADIRKFKQDHKRATLQSDAPSSSSTNVDTDTDLPQVWTPSPEVFSAITNALLKKRQPPEALLVMPPQPREEPNRLPRAAAQQQLDWPSAPYSKPSKTKYGPYRKSSNEFIPSNLTPTSITSGLDRLKVPYGTIRRRPPVWGPRSSTSNPWSS